MEEESLIMVGSQMVAPRMTEGTHRTPEAMKGVESLHLPIQQRCPHLTMDQAQGGAAEAQSTAHPKAVSASRLESLPVVGVILIRLRTAKGGRLALGRVQ
jgi:hypothetical protein